MNKINKNQIPTAPTHYSYCRLCYDNSFVVKKNPSPFINSNLFLLCNYVKNINYPSLHKHSFYFVF